MELKDSISEYRRDNGISQREFARRSGLSNSLISILEMGTNPQTGKKMAPDLQTYKKLAAAMGTTVQALFERIGDSESVNISRITVDLSNDEYYLISLYRGAEDHAKEFAKDTLKKYQKQDTASEQMA